MLAKLGYLSASMAYWVVGTGCGVVDLSCLFLNRKKFKLSFKQANADLQRNLSIGVWIFGSGLVWSARNYLYPWLLAAFHGTASTAVWAACLGVVALCNPLVMGLQNFFTPQMAHAYAEGRIRTLQGFCLRTVTKFGLALLPFCLLLFMFGGHLVSGFYGKKYVGNGLIVSILAVNLLVLSLSFAPSRALFTLQRADVDFKINIVSFLILLSCGMFLAKHYGPVGAAAGALLSNSTSLVLLLIVFSRLVRSQKSCRESDRSGVHYQTFER